MKVREDGRDLEFANELGSLVTKYNDLEEDQLCVAMMLVAAGLYANIGVDEAASIDRFRYAYGACERLIKARAHKK